MRTLPNPTSPACPPSNLLDEVLLSLSPSSVQLFTPNQPEILSYLSPIVNSLPQPPVNHTVLKDNATFGVDNDQAEISKVNEFKRLAEKCRGKRVGLMIPGGFDGDTDNVERWPLIASFGIQSQDGSIDLDGGLVSTEVRPPSSQGFGGRPFKLLILLLRNVD